MEATTVEKLIKGVGVIIDDDAEIKGTLAAQILSSVKAAGIPMVVYTDIPDASVIDSLGNISFIILDWDFTPSQTVNQLPAGVELGDEFLKEQKQTILEFLKKLLDKIFVPVFLITGQDFENVKSELSDAGVYHEEEANRILLKSKEEVHNYESLIQSIGQWVEKTPSAHVLKLWESEAVEAKNRMFLDMYTASSNWVNVLLRILRADSINNKKAINHDLAELLNNNFINRISGTVDYDSVEAPESICNQNEIRRVLQGERYITYDQDSLPDICYVGDLYRMNGKKTYPYRLNIRAQCDITREDNPKLYLIPGRKLKARNITKQPGIEITEEGDEKILRIEQQQYCLKELLDDIDNKTNNFNKEMEKYKKPLLYVHGEIIEKKTHSIVACIAEETLIEFCFREFEVINKEELDAKATRIGRLLPPYITKVQNAFASFMIRTGIMPVPEELLG